MTEMAKVYAIVIGLLFLVILICSGGWYVSHLKGEVTTAQAKQSVAEASVSTCAIALGQADSATAAAVARAETYKAQAQAIIDSATTQKGQNTAAGTVFATKIITSAKTTDCQSVLEATLCPALSGY